jgi:hypothetical protein
VILAYRPSGRALSLGDADREDTTELVSSNAAKKDVRRMSSYIGTIGDGDNMNETFIAFHLHGFPFFRDFPTSSAKSRERNLRRTLNCRG